MSGRFHAAADIGIGTAILLIAVVIGYPVYLVAAPIKRSLRLIQSRQAREHDGKRGRPKARLRST